MTAWYMTSDIMTYDTRQYDIWEHAIISAIFQSVTKCQSKASTTVVYNGGACFVSIHISIKAKEQEIRKLRNPGQLIYSIFSVAISEFFSSLESYWFYK